MRRESHPNIVNRYKPPIHMCLVKGAIPPTADAVSDHEDLKNLILSSGSKALGNMEQLFHHQREEDLLLINYNNKKHLIKKYEAYHLTIRWNDERKVIPD